MGFVDAHEPGLADGGASLDGRQVGGTLPQAERHHARRDRPAGDDDALVAVADERGDLGGQTAELPHVERVAARGGEQAGAEFDDDPRVQKLHRAAQTSATHRLGRPIRGCKGAATLLKCRSVLASSRQTPHS